jgi:hypothetical protein
MFLYNTLKGFISSWGALSPFLTYVCQSIFLFVIVSVVGSVIKLVLVSLVDSAVVGIAVTHDTLRSKVLLELGSVVIFGVVAKLHACLLIVSQYFSSNRTFGSQDLLTYVLVVS